MQKKRILALVLSLVLALSACGQGETLENTGDIQSGLAQGNSQEEVSKATSEPAKSPEEIAAEKAAQEAAEDAARIQELYDNRPISLKQMEAMNRGFVAVRSEEDTFLSWRFLATDDLDLAFNVYQNGTLLNAEPIEDVTSYLVEGTTETARQKC